MDLNVCLPRPEDLFDSADLSEMSSNSNFKFLIQTGYEHIQRTTTTTTTSGAPPAEKMEM